MKPLGRGETGGVNGGVKGGMGGGGLLRGSGGLDAVLVGDKGTAPGLLLVCQPVVILNARKYFNEKISIKLFLLLQ